MLAIFAKNILVLMVDNKAISFYNNNYAIWIMPNKTKNNKNKILSDVKKQVQSLYGFDDELNLTFLKSLSVKAMLQEIKHSFGNHRVVMEEMMELSSVRDILDRNITLKKTIFNFSDAKYKKELNMFLKVYNKQKSNVIKKNMLRSVIIKNILIRLGNEFHSLFELK